MNTSKRNRSQVSEEKYPHSMASSKDPIASWTAHTSEGAQAMRLDLNDGVLDELLELASNGRKDIHLTFGKAIVSRMMYGIGRGADKLCAVGSTLWQTKPTTICRSRTDCVRSVYIHADDGAANFSHWYPQSPACNERCPKASCRH